MSPNKPIRVLHLVDPASPGGGACTLHLLAEVLRRLNSIEHHVLVIGNRRRADLVRRCGVRGAGQINPPLGVPALARPQLKIWRRFTEHSAGRFDLVHAWTLESALLAGHVFRNTPMVATCSVGPTAGTSTSLLKALARKRPFPILTSSPGVFGRCASLGFDSEVLSVLPPAVHPQSVGMTPRAEVRRRWNVDDDTFVVGLLSDPWSWADALGGADILARLASAGRRMRLLVHHRAHRRVAAEKWIRSLGWSDFIDTDNNIAEPWSIVNGLDAALFVGSDMNVNRQPPQESAASMPATMPLLWAMAAEVPVIAESNDAVRDVIEEGRNGLLVSSGDRVAASNRLLRVHDDRSLAHRLGGAGLQTVHDRFHVSSFAVRLKDTYEHVLQGLPAHVLGVDQRPWVVRHVHQTESWTIH